ncbi:unnamed protein product [Vitrella brassicaformis CCMP3155]|uniref:Thioredoxin domain-containing protein n=1 Tax=Vitrella brassicaformis (strain CCMP3155) TaxID=1169540 RepID=A0A0G4EGH5_VITBC|nr:unnamed protein product [Vitrella brassicaformis CCMP3155]|eukprot:CEL94524.1 unnamed protein product [Vitrella brassicaformis CCMP3155]
MPRVAVVEKMSEEHSDVQFLYVDIDENNLLSEEFDIHSVPTFKLTKNGQEKDTLTGAQPEKLRELVQSNK